MRKIAAILLLGGLLYNWLGYRLVYDYLQHRADRALEARLDRQQYDDSRLVEIRIPLNLPYQSNWSDFERYDGDIEVEGVHYKYVKRKVYNDTLIVLCLPNDTRQQIQDARNDFFRLINDLQHSSKKGHSGSDNFFKSLLTEYRPEQNNWIIAPPALHKASYHRQNDFLFSLYSKAPPGKPPEAPAV